MSNPCDAFPVGRALLTDLLDLHHAVEAHTSALARVTLAELAGRAPDAGDLKASVRLAEEVSRLRLRIGDAHSDERIRLLTALDPPQRQQPSPYSDGARL